jgi:hypothetical protein
VVWRGRLSGCGSRSGCATLGQVNAWEDSERAPAAVEGDHADSRQDDDPWNGNDVRRSYYSRSPCREAGRSPIM